jgi:hypothetical protein
LGAEFRNLGRLLGLLGGEAGSAGSGDNLGEFGFQPGAVAGLDFAKLTADLREQIVVEETGDFGALGIHHPVDAEVEVGLIEHEQLGEDGL